MGTALRSELTPPFVDDSIDRIRSVYEPECLSLLCSWWFLVLYLCLCFTVLLTYFYVVRIFCNTFGNDIGLFSRFRVETIFLIRKYVQFGICTVFFNVLSNICDFSSRAPTQVNIMPNRPCGVNRFEMNLGFSHQSSASKFLSSEWKKSISYYGYGVRSSSAITLCPERKELN